MYRETIGLSARSELKLRIILEQPPKDCDFGLQKGRGSVYEIVQTKRFTGKDLVFEFTVGVKPDGKGPPALAGPFVQGPAGARFVYIHIGTYAGQADSILSRRLQVPLSGLTTALIQSSAGLV